MRALRGLFSQVFLRIILPVIVLMALVTFGSITLHQRAMRAAVASRNARLARLGAAMLEARLQERLRALERIAARWPDASSIPLAELESLAPLFDEGIVSLNPTGEILAGIRTERVREALRAAPAGWLRKMLQSPGSPQTLILSSTEGSARLLIGLGLRGGGLIGGVSDSALGLSEWPTLLRAGPRTHVYLIDPEGRVALASEPSRIGEALGAHPGVAEVLRMEPGIAFYRPAGGGDEHVISYAPILSLRGGVLIEEPWIDETEPILRYTLLTPLLILTIAVASLMLLELGWRRVVRPLQILGQRAIRLAWGDFQAIQQPVGGVGEIEDLQRILQEMAEQIRRYQGGMRDYIAALTRAQEEERQRMARELHDELVQSLVAIAQRIRLIEWQLPPGPEGEELRRALQALSGMIRQTIQEVRRLIQALRPLYLEELGLVSALEALMESTAREGLEVTLEVSGEERRLPAEMELALYRIAQEGLSNVIRHAQARQVTLRLAFGAEGITLTLEDDGVGFVPPETPGELAMRGHFGLMGMYERAARLGGHFSIRSAPGQGTRIVAFLPYPPDSPSSSLP